MDLPVTREMVKAKGTPVMARPAVAVELVVLGRAALEPAVALEAVGAGVPVVAVEAVVLAQAA